MEIQNSERGNSEYALFESQRELESQRRQLLKANQWADQAQRERIHLCGRTGMKDHLHKESYARSCREIEELKRRCYQEEDTEKQRRLEELPTQHDQESRTVSLLRDQARRLQEQLKYIYIYILKTRKSSMIFTHRAVVTATYVPHQALITSISRTPGREVGLLRNTQEDMSTRGDVFDCQRARRDPDELHNDSRNLAASSAILRREGIEKSGSEEPLQPIFLPCFS